MLAKCWAIWRFWLGYVGPDIPIFVGHECHGVGAPQIWCLTALMLAIMESRLWLSEPMLGLCWANVGQMLGHLKRFWLAYVGPDIPIFVGHECEGFGAPQIWCLTALMLAIMESRLWLSEPMLGVCWAYVGQMLGHLKRFWLAYVGPDIPIFVGHECHGVGAPQIWCLTALMLAIMESRLWLSEPMLGLCWAYVGPILGYSDGWVGLCWARYSHILWGTNVKVLVPHKFGVWQCSVWIASCQTYQNVLCPAIHVSKIYPKSLWRASSKRHIFAIWRRHYI